MSVSSTRVCALQTGRRWLVMLSAWDTTCPPSRTLCSGRMSLSLWERMSFLMVPKSC